MNSPGTSLVFEYFFSIGAGIAAGFVCVIVPSLVIYRLIQRKFETKTGGID